MSESIVIVTGGALGRWALAHIGPDDVLVGADRGALFLLRNGRRPELALGDFDSVTAEEKEDVRRGSAMFVDCDPVMKDWTDTEMAFNWALERKPRRIVMLGALGSRFDHSLANVHLLRKGLERGIECSIVDGCNEVRLIDREATIVRAGYTYVSLLPLTIDVTGITLTGFRYPLVDATLSIGQSLGISNELAGETGHIRIRDGLLLVIQSKDETPFDGS
ncbi:thiamine diphosphokinase [Paenibacillus flagellatus]|uniref:Thiamine diphosphokinase n=1 Tax=Paenibacillus flagellatus TaxID=2211139 RepID=A0A2V5KUF4_9BACL|nr:thiamine diphosphokinase [Paenibacillus flagellatus]PYI52976.1 thiamine diphosphokinase [Paenibacillus flagellatus]